MCVGYSYLLPFINTSTWINSGQDFQTSYFFINPRLVRKTLYNKFTSQTSDYTKRNNQPFVTIFPIVLIYRIYFNPRTTIRWPERNNEDAFLIIIHIIETQSYQEILLVVQFRKDDRFPVHSCFGVFFFLNERLR